MTDSVLIEVENRIATLTLNRPALLNALDPDMAEGLRASTAQVAADDSVRCVVVRGAGDNFMAGGDITYFQRCLELDPEQQRTAIHHLINCIHESVESLREMPKPVIASARGAVAGFGLSLLACCDLAVVSENCVFTLAYCNIGISPDGGSTYHLPRMIGAKRAMELALLGDRFDAHQARSIGLVNRVVPPDQLTQQTAALAQRLAAGPTLAYGHTKALINASLQSTLSAQLHAEESSFVEGIASADFAEGVHAFCEKRKPRFRGA